MKKDEFIKLSKEERTEMAGLIKRFFAEERDEEIGDLAAEIVLDFFVEKLSAKFYNQGVSDSYAYMSDRMLDLLGLQK